LEPVCSFFLQLGVIQGQGLVVRGDSWQSVLLFVTRIGSSGGPEARA